MSQTFPSVVVRLFRNIYVKGFRLRKQVLCTVGTFRQWLKFWLAFCQTKSTMGCKSNPKDADMQKESSQREDIVTDCESRTSHSTGQDRSPQSNTVPNSNISSGPQNTLAVPTTPVRPAHQHMHHSSTDPHLHGSRPHSAHLHHRLMGRILRGMGDSYCYSCGIALRQMGDELSGEYEVRRALSTGDLPNSIKNS